MTRLLSRAPERLHHHAYVVKDQEKNRQFFEDILGIPLTATWCEKHFNAWVGREVSFCHTFYSLGDGGALAFFSFADEEVYRKTQAEKPRKSGVSITSPSRSMKPPSPNSPAASKPPD